MPVIASKSLRTKESGYTPPDPHVSKIAKIGKEEEDYTYMINCIKDKVLITTVKEGSELKKIQG